ncbi:hypothetical protein QE364_000643 [Nocardioides zeae]|uniref:Uncharacterized protein n=1 Tax=Nocardioides zeae TaxID=1457234 RepID=A0ACC6IDW0_9ACTN|nr:hypothetical protein [Nocardioides zeae]MDR6174144.1 hypothetical protein [Nocardioides zeae]MDR6208951.1 hypothetical protein [Nocardioides zeae]
MQVSTPDGRTVVVRRRMLPWRPRRRLRYQPGDASDVDLGDDGLVVVVAGIVLLVLVVPLLAIVGVLLAELLLLVLVLPLFWLAKVLLRRPWIVEVVEQHRVLRAESVRGWRASGDLARALADEIARGHLPLKSV